MRWYPTSREKRARCGAPGLCDRKRRPSDQIFPSAPGGKFACPPQIPARYRAPGLPLRRPPLHLLRLGQHIGGDRLACLDPPEGQQISLANSIIRARKDIRPPQPEDQQHLRRPRPDPAHVAQPLDNFAHPASAVLRQSSAPYRPGSWPRDHAAREASPARARRHEASPLARPAIAPAADAYRQTTPANVPGWHGQHWRAVAGTESPRAALQTASECFSPATQTARRVRSAPPAWRPRPLIAVAPAHCRNEPGAGLVHKNNFNFSHPYRRCKQLPRSECSQFRRFCSETALSLWSQFRLSRPRRVAYPPPFAAIFNFPSMMRGTRTDGPPSWINSQNRSRTFL